MKSRIRKWLFLLMALTCFGAIAENRLYIEDFNISPGETKELQLRGKVEFILGGFQVRIKLPEGLSCVPTNGNYATFYDESNNVYTNWMFSNAKIISDDDLTEEDDTGALSILTVKRLDGGQYEADVDYCYATIKVSASSEFTSGKILMYNMKLSSKSGEESAKLPNLYVSVNGDGAMTEPADNKAVWGDNFEILPGETKELELKVKSDINFAGVQTDIYLPSFLSFETTSESSYFDVSETFSNWDMHKGNRFSSTHLRILLATYSATTDYVPAGTYSIGKVKVKATGNAAGADSIRFTNGKISSTLGESYAIENGGLIVDVSSTVVPVTSVGLNNNLLQLSAGESAKLSATILPTNASNKTVQWKTSNSSVAAVTANGLVTAVSAGTATITATTTDGTNLSETCTVIVSNQTADNNKLYINDFTIAPGQTKEIELRGMTNFRLGGFQCRILLPEGLSWGKIKGRYHQSFDDDENGIYPSWLINESMVLTVDDPETVGVDDSGALSLMWAKWTGEAEANFYEPNKDYCYMTLKVTASDDFDGGTIQMYNMKYSDWAGKKPTVLDDLYVNASLPKILAESITLNASSIELIEEDTQQLTTTVLPSNASDKTVTWTSSNSRVATVNTHGLVTAVSAGTAIITARTNDGSNLTASCAVTVNPRFVPATSVGLNISSCTLDVGDTQQLTATVMPENATNKSVVWTSSDESVATVDENGLVTAHKGGTATISANTTDGSNLSADCLVNVNPQFIVTAAPQVSHVRGGEPTITDFEIGLTNDIPISGMELTVELPSCLTLTSTNGIYDVSLDENRKSRNHTVNAEKTGEHSYRIVISSITFRNLSGNDGTVLRMNVGCERIHNETGAFEIGIKDIALTSYDTDGEENRYTANDVSVPVMLSYLVGDATADLNVDAADYVNTANHILNMEKAEPFFADAANAHYANEQINVADLVAITNIALELREKEYRPAGAPKYDSDETTNVGGSVSVDATVETTSEKTTSVTLNLSNDMDIAALQLDFTLPQGTDIASASTSVRGNKHNVAFNRLNNGKVRLILSSYSPAVIESGDGAIAQINLTRESTSDKLITVSEIIAVEPSLTVHELQQITLDVTRATGVENIGYNDVHIFASNGNIVINSPVSGLAQLVAINGMTLTLEVKAGHNVYPVETAYGKFVVVRFLGQVAKLQL